MLTYSTLIALLITYCHELIDNYLCCAYMSDNYRGTR